MKFRVYFGALTSLLDIYTDIDAIVRFFKEGNVHFAYANIAFVGVSLLCQLIVVFIQNKKRGWKALMYESMIVCSMLKPAIDAKRVVSGNIQVENAFGDPQLESTFNKCAEMIGESIPSSVLQTYALLGASEVTNGPLFSIVISAGSIAYASTTISLDFDTNPANRLKAPNFYGYVPDNGRLAVMILMISISTSHVLLKVIACSLMLRLNQTWFIIYMTGDQSLYFLYKLLRGDWRYGLLLPGLVSWVVSVFVRVMIKTIVDFTLIIHYRHPFDLGGIYWSTNIVLNQAFCFVSVIYIGNTPQR